MNKFDRARRPHGKWVDWWPSGQMKFTGNYIHGEKNGLWIGKFKNKTISRRVFWINGLRDGEQVDYGY